MKKVVTITSKGYVQCKHCGAELQTGDDHVRVEFKTHHLELCMDCAQSIRVELSEKLKQYNWSKALEESAELV